VDRPARTVLQDLEKRLADDPRLRAGGAVSFYRLVRNRFVREIL